MPWAMCRGLDVNLVLRAVTLLLNSYVEVNDRICRILRPLIVDLKICFVAPVSAQLVLRRRPNTAPHVHNDFCTGPCSDVNTAYRPARTFFATIPAGKSSTFVTRAPSR